MPIHKCMESRDTRNGIGDRAYENAQFKKDL